jgi:hypothetical protein
MEVATKAMKQRAARFLIGRNFNKDEEGKCDFFNLL